MCGLGDPYYMILRMRSELYTHNNGLSSWLVIVYNMA